MASQPAHICQLAEAGRGWPRLAEAGGRPEFDLAPGGGAGGQVGRTSCATTFHRCSSPRTPSTMRSFSSTTSSVRTGRWSPGTAPCIKDGIGNLPKICRSKNMNPRDLRRVHEVFYDPYLNVFTSTLSPLSTLSLNSQNVPRTPACGACVACARGCVPFEIDFACFENERSDPQRDRSSLGSATSRTDATRHTRDAVPVVAAQLGSTSQPLTQGPHGQVARLHI